MATSRIAAAIDGLLALCNAQTDTVGESLYGVAVFDGPPITESSEQLELYIGFDEDRVDSFDRYSVEGTQKYQTMGGPREETFAILCAAVSRSGDTNMKTERDRVLLVMAAVENLIRLGVAGSDITLGGSVLASNVSGDIKLLQLQTTEGAYAKLSFYVQCIASV